MNTEQYYKQWTQQNFDTTRRFTPDELKAIHIEDKLTAADINQMTLTRFQNLDMMTLTELKRKAPAVYKKFHDMEMREAIRKTATV